ncbi:MAG: Zn finger-containing GTPase- Activating Protein for ARF, partial [Candelina submexicana]
MDAFKIPEIKRMELGGNSGWKGFWEEKNEGSKWEDVAVSERYDSAAGEEWKERLSAKVEGREYVPLPSMEKKVSAAKEGGRSGTPVGVGRGKAGNESPLRSSSPAPSLGGGNASKKAQNEAYFARLGDANKNRSADLPPSQGGKFSGFGSEPMPASGDSNEGKAMPGVDEFQQDPVKALTKGFGWFTASVGKGVKGVNEGWIQPTAQKLAEADLATQARLTAANLGQTIQSSTKNTAETFNRFVEGQGGNENNPSAAASKSRNTYGTVDEDKRAFWDNFGGAAETSKPSGMGMGGGSKSSAIGTAAMRKGGSGA